MNTNIMNRTEEVQERPGQRVKDGENMGPLFESGGQWCVCARQASAGEGQGQQCRWAELGRRDEGGTVSTSHRAAVTFRQACWHVVNWQLVAPR